MKSVIIIAIAFVLLIPISVFADSHNIPRISVSTDLEKYGNGDTVFITGNIRDFDPSNVYALTFLVISPTNDIVKIGQIYLSSDGSFQTTILTGGPLWELSGDYAFEIKYGSTSGDTTIVYTGGDQVISEPPPPPPVDKEPEPEVQEKLDEIEKITDENEYSPKPREWISSGPFQIDRSEYAIGEKIFIRIEGLEHNEKGEIAVMRQLNSNQYLEYHTIPFDGAQKAVYNYYIEPQISADRKIYSTDDLVGKWEMVFRGTNYQSLKFEITEEVIPGTNTQPEEIVCPQGFEPVNGKCPDKPVVEQSKEHGIASFVEKSKDPRYYIDRYNNELEYKEWFDDNYPQYDSIEQAVGLELTQKIPDWIKNVFLWYGQDQVSEDELLNAIKYLINERILIVN